MHKLSLHSLLSEVLWLLGILHMLLLAFRADVYSDLTVSLVARTSICNIK